MAIPFSLSGKHAPFTAASLINKTSRVFESRLDSRKKATANHLKYAIADAAWSAFSVFFTLSPSFLDYQTRMQQAHGKTNAQSICGVPPIPSANPSRNLLDPVPPETVFFSFSRFSRSHAPAWECVF